MARRNPSKGSCAAFHARIQAKERRTRPSPGHQFAARSPQTLDFPGKIQVGRIRLSPLSLRLSPLSLQAVPSFPPLACYDSTMDPGSHRRLELRSLSMHRAIAAKLRAQPDLVRIARDNLDRWALSAGRSTPYLEEWRRILDLPAGEVASLIEEDSERMTALRQSSPFAGVLTPKERWRIYDAYAIGTYHPGVGHDRERR